MVEHNEQEQNWEEIQEKGGKRRKWRENRQIGKNIINLFHIKIVFILIDKPIYIGQKVKLELLNY